MWRSASPISATVTARSALGGALVALRCAVRLARRVFDNCGTFDPDYVDPRSLPPSVYDAMVAVALNPTDSDDCSLFRARARNHRRIELGLLDGDGMPLERDGAHLPDIYSERTYTDAARRILAG